MYYLYYALEERKIVILVVYIDDLLITWNVISKIYKLKEFNHNQTSQKQCWTITKTLSKL
jgi:hypothetical protein